MLQPSDLLLLSALSDFSVSELLFNRACWIAYKQKYYNINITILQAKVVGFYNFLLSCENSLYVIDTCKYVTCY